MELDMVKPSSRDLAEVALEKLHVICNITGDPRFPAPGSLGETSVTLFFMVRKMAEYADGEDTGGADQPYDDIMWNLVRKAAEQAIADFKKLADKLDYQIL